MQDTPILKTFTLFLFAIMPNKGYVPFWMLKFKTSVGSNFKQQKNQSNAEQIQIRPGSLQSNVATIPAQVF